MLCYEVKVLKRPASACIVCFVFAVDCGAGTVGARPCSACPQGCGAVPRQREDLCRWMEAAGTTGDGNGSVMACLS